MRLIRSALWLCTLWLMASATMGQDFAVLAGPASSHNLGERSPFVQVFSEYRLPCLSVEGTWLSADKVETGDGWLVNGALDYWAGPLSVGAGYTYRHTGAWSKRVWWARAGIEHKGLRLLAIVAPGSPNMEARLEARLRLSTGHLALEPRFWVGTHTTAEELGSYAYGASMLVGVTTTFRGGGRR